MDKNEKTGYLTGIVVILSKIPNGLVLERRPCGQYFDHTVYFSTISFDLFVNKDYILKCHLRSGRPHPEKCSCSGREPAVARR